MIFTKVLNMDNHSIEKMIDRAFNCMNECTYHPHRSHNELFRALYKKGILDLLLYMTLLAGNGVKLIPKGWRNKAPLNRLGIMLLAKLLIDAMGFVRGRYPGYRFLGWVSLDLHFVAWRKIAAR